MADWKPGDEAVYIGHKGYSMEALRIGQKVTISHDLGMGICGQHGEAQGVDIVEVPVDPSPQVIVTDLGIAVSRKGYCAHCFRRPINFKSLCNINTSKEIENV